jgi:hypothetical protein
VSLVGAGHEPSLALFATLPVIKQRARLAPEEKGRSYGVRLDVNSKSDTGHKYLWAALGNSRYILPPNCGRLLAVI